MGIRKNMGIRREKFFNTQFLLWNPKNSHIGELTFFRCGKSVSFLSDISSNIIFCSSSVVIIFFFFYFYYVRSTRYQLLVLDYLHYIYIFYIIIALTEYRYFIFFKCDDYRQCWYFAISLLASINHSLLCCYGNEQPNIMGSE